MGLRERLFGKSRSATGEKQVQRNDHMSPIEITSEIMARLIVHAFSLAKFTELFARETLAEGWSWSDALATWYSLGDLALMNSKWKKHAITDENARLIIDSVRSRLLVFRDLPDPTLDRMLVVIGETEAQAIKSFNACASGIDLMTFFARYSSLILGSPIPFVQISEIEELLGGVEYRGLNPVRSTAISRLFLDLGIELENILSNAKL